MTRPFSHGKKHGKRQGMPKKSLSQVKQIPKTPVQNISADLDDLAIHEKHSVI